MTETRIVSVGATRAPRRGETIRRGGAGAAVVVGALATAAGLVLACALVDEWLDPQALIASANNNNRDERRTSALGARPGHLLAADVAQLGRLGLKPGYDLLYDFATSPEARTAAATEDLPST